MHTIMLQGLNKNIPRLDLEQQVEEFMRALMKLEDEEDAIWEVLVSSDFSKGIELKKKLKLKMGKLETKRSSINLIDETNLS